MGYQEKKRPLPNPQESIDAFLEMIKGKKDGVTLEEALSFGNREDIWLGPFLSTWDLIRKYEKIGVLEIDLDEKKIKFSKAFLSPIPATLRESRSR